MSIQIERFQQIAKEHGLKMQEQAAFHKIAVGDCAVYVARTQKVSRVDLSGFTIRHPAVREPDKKVGRVQSQLDFSKSEERVLEAFSTALSRMQELAQATATDSPPRRRSPAKKAPVQARPPVKRPGSSKNVSA